MLIFFKRLTFSKILDESSERSEPFSPSCSSYAPSESEEQSSAPSKSRKRLQKPSTWKVNVRKRARNSGKSYTTKKGKVVPEKKFSNFNCSCSKKCSTLLSLAQREKLFEKFYKLENFDLQTVYIRERVQVKEKARAYTKKAETSRRKYSRCFCLPDERGTDVIVCKRFFLKSFGISNGRLSRALKGKEKGSPPHKDQRGKAPPANKTPDEKVKRVETFIQNFPSYASHYGREKAGTRRYLSPDLNITIMYDLYKTELEKESQPAPVSAFVFRKIFNENFNLHFHPPITDSCRRCDEFQVKLKQATGEERRKLEFEKELHHRKAEAARDGMKMDAERGKNTDNDVTVIAFDLMKTLPTPVISTGICYYKRQLWTYCLGVHNLSTNEAFLYVWDEAIASRGAQEIASCLMHFIRNHVKTTELIMYSDQCGGQNRNIKMYSFCNFITCSSNFVVNRIDHKFLVSGHSYLACDEDFGLIEKRKKYHSNIYVPDDWVPVFKEARKRKPFIVIKMRTEDFFSSKELEERITNRKTNAEKAQVQWLKIQWIQISRDLPYIMRYKYSNNEDPPFYEVNLAKRNTSTRPEISLSILYPRGRPVTKAKKQDLIDLLPFIPPICHDFYKNLKSSQEADDFGLFGDSAPGEL